ncbi:MAG: hypothetical protein JXA14_22870 [Anaerolineae bacterium]|nr:hypothetical protein [Anaerolineae bacterium]
MPQTFQIIATVAGIVSTILAAVMAGLMFRANKRKVIAEAKQADATASSSLVNAASEFVDDLRAEMRDLRDRVGVLERQIQERDETIIRLHSDLEKQIQKRDETIIRLRSDLEASNQAIAALEALVEQQARQLNTLRSDLTKAETRIRMLERENEQLRHENCQLRKQHPGT